MWHVGWKYLFIFFSLFTFTSCMSEVDISINDDENQSLFVSKNNPTGPDLGEEINLNIGENITFFALIKNNNSGVENIPVKWSLIGDMGNLLVTNAGKEANFNALKVGTATVIVENNGIEVTFNIIVSTPPVVQNCSGVESFSSNSMGEIGQHFFYQVDATKVGCTFQFTVDGAGGGRGNHSSPNDTNGGDGGRIIFEFTPNEEGQFKFFIGEGGTGAVEGSYSINDPVPGAGGGGSTNIIFDPSSGAEYYLAVAGGGGGGGWGEHGSHGGGGDNDCGSDADEGSTGGCNGVTGTPHPGGDIGGDCPSDGIGIEPGPCGGPGGDGSGGFDANLGGFGFGAGAGGDEVGHNDS